MLADRAIADGLPDDLAVHAANMAKTCSIAAIDRNLTHLAAERSIPKSWTAAYLRNRFNPGHRAADAGECASILAELEERKQSTGLEYFVRTDGEDVVDRIFFELDGGVATWSRNVDTNVLLFDPTWGTNKETFYLCCFTTVGNTGENEILAACLLKSESFDMFTWAFRCFAAVFKTSPLNFFSDGDDKIAEAFKSMHADGVDASSGDATPGPWAKASHRLCVFHLSQNFFTHIKPVFGADFEGWKEAMSLFWHIAKETDSRSRSHFDADWFKLTSLVEECAETPARAAGLEWLQKLGEKKEKFCLRYVWNSITYGLHSTQRAESTQSQVKKKCCANGRLSIIILIRELDLLNAQSRNNRAVDMALMKAKQSLLSESTPVVEFLQKHVNPYALKLVYEQARQSTMYLSTDLDDSLGGRTVYRRGQAGVAVLPSRDLVLIFDDFGNVDWSSNLGDEDFGRDEVTTSRYTRCDQCSCQFATSFGGLPCRHMQHLYSLNMTTNFDFLLTGIQMKWRLVSPEVAQERLSALRVMKPPSTNALAPRATQGMSRTERYKELQLVFGALAELSTVNDAVHDQAMSGMRALVKQLIDTPAQPPSRAHASSAAQWELPSSSGSRRQAGTDSAAAVSRQPSAPAADRSATGSAAKEKAPGSATDENSLASALGVGWKLQKDAPTEYDASSDDWWNELLGKHVVYKEKPKTQGGWYAGKIVCVRVNEGSLIYVEQFPDIVYPSDDDGEELDAEPALTYRDQDLGEYETPWMYLYLRGWEEFGSDTIRGAKVGNMFAVEDSDDMITWRRSILERVSTNKWSLLEETGENVLETHPHNGGNGVPAEFDMYYRLPSAESFNEAQKYAEGYLGKPGASKDIGVAPQRKRARGSVAAAHAEGEEDAKGSDADSNDGGAAQHAHYTESDLRDMVPEGSVVVHFQSDKSWDVLPLRIPMYSTSATAKIHSWSLLEDKPLGVPADAPALNPRRPLPKGKQRARRHRQAAGPMASGGKKHGTKKSHKKMHH